jgi:hypothetical protein
MAKVAGREAADDQRLHAAAKRGVPVKRPFTMPKANSATNVKPTERRSA